MLKLFVLIVALLVVVLALFVLIARKTGSTVYVERTFPASVEKVWSLWNDPAAMKQWWGPKDYSAPVIDNDFRPGGRFLLSMKPQQGQTIWNTGSYKTIVPHQKIVSSLSFSNEDGKALPGNEAPAPGVWPDEVTVTVEFRGTHDKTTVAVTEEGIPLIMKWFAGMGWKQQFDKFEALLRRSQ